MAKWGPRGRIERRRQYRGKVAMVEGKRKQLKNDLSSTMGKREEQGGTI